ncbi:conjugal transfer protein TraF [Bacillus sp. APMAM]|nr:conjugal transfer protein TraF [Bacillus sp. APMAM]RTZ53221.1 hypothetical protein EKO25_24480 [Bacillus sp. SAJ1]
MQDFIHFLHDFVFFLQNTYCHKQDEKGNKVIAKELFSGRNTLLLFINTNCPRCKSLLPHLMKIKTNYDINFILVNTDRLADDNHIKSVIGDQITYIRSTQISSSYFVHVVPYAVLVNNIGEVKLSSQISNINSLFNMLINEESFIKENLG